MAKTKISEFSPTPANNTDIDNINIAEGCAPSGINDAIRELMAQLKDFQAGTAGDSFNGPIGTTTAVTGAFTNITASGTLGVTGIATLGNGAVLGTPASVTLTNGTGLPISTGVSGLGTGIATALAVNVGTAGAPVVNGGALGTPSSGTVTNLTGTASININGTVGATTATTGAFTTLAASGAVTLSGGTANGVAYLNGSKVLTTGSALTFDGAKLVNTSGVAGGLIQSTDTGGTGSFLRMLGDATSGNLINWTTGTALRFATSADNFGSFAEQMRLTSTGLGIGTSSPGYLITAQNSSTPILQIGDGIRHVQLRGGSTTQNPAIGTYYAGDFTLVTNSTERVRLDSAGNLGLGVTPSAWSVYKAFQVGRGALVNATTETDLVHNAYWNGSNWIYNATDFASRHLQINGQHRFYTAPSGTAGAAITFTQAMTLDASGRLGIGKTSMTYPLDVAADSSGNGIRLTRSTTTEAVMYQNSSGQTTLATTGSGAALIFGTGTTVGSPTERMRLDSAGNLGLGVTPSAYWSTYKAIQLGNAAVSSASTNYAFFGLNWAENKYISAGFASLYEQNNGNHRWFIAPSGTAGNAITFTQAMTLDASGNLLVGTTTGLGGGRAHFQQNADANYSTTHTTATTRTQLVLRDSSATATYSNPFSTLLMGAGDLGAAYTTITCVRESTQASAIAFGTANSSSNTVERARIDSSGKLVVGNTTATNALLGAFNSANVPLVAAWSSASSGYTDALLLSEFRNYSPNNATARFSYFGDNAAARAVFYSNGGLYNYQANNVNLSDRREKTNFAPAKSYLETICAIPVQTFNYIDQNMEEDGGLTLGVVAQDVQAVAPELVMESNWGTEDEPKMRLSIYQTDLQYALMKAIQEQQAIIESLKARLDAANL